MRTILFIITIGISSLMGGDFTRANDVVTDSRSTLEWQDNNETNSTTKTWIDAINYCENLTLSGKIDWRLPNLNELTSLVDDKRYNSSIDAIFQNISSNRYWSSTTNVNNNSLVWIVSFSYGGQNYYTKTDSYYVRCVRAGQ